MTDAKALFSSAEESYHQQRKNEEKILQQEMMDVLKQAEKDRDDLKAKIIGYLKENDLVAKTLQKNYEKSDMNPEAKYFVYQKCLAILKVESLKMSREGKDVSNLETFVKASEEILSSQLTPAYENFRTKQFMFNSRMDAVGSTRAVKNFISIIERNRQHMEFLIAYVLEGTSVFSEIPRKTQEEERPDELPDKVA